MSEVGETAETGAPVTVTEWGIVVDDLGSTDMAESYKQAQEWFDAGQGSAIVQVIVTEWPRVCPPAQPTQPRTTP